MNDCIAIVPAAGSGVRLGGEVPKALVEINKSQTILEKTVSCLIESEIFSYIVVAAKEEEKKQFSDVLEKYSKEFEINVITGGKSRQESVLNSLDFINTKSKYVLIHDAARPLCHVNDIKEVFEATRVASAAILAEPIQSTVKRVNPKSSVVLETVPRNGLWSALTPQGFEFELIYQAHQKALEDGFEGTDDSSLVERMGREVKIVPASSCNLKITTQVDLELVKKLI